MIKFLVILFIIKLYTRNIFTRIKKKHGQDVRKLVRSYQSLMSKYIKVTADIKFIELYKVEKIITTFAKVNLSIKSGSRKLKLRIARLGLESEIQSKHIEMKKSKVSFAIKSRQKVILKHHEKKLIKFRKNQNIAPQSHKPSFAKCIVHNFSSYDLSDAEIAALSYGLDTHIPINTNSNTIATEFELFAPRTY